MSKTTVGFQSFTALAQKDQADPAGFVTGSHGTIGDASGGFLAIEWELLEDYMYLLMFMDAEYGNDGSLQTHQYEFITQIKAGNASIDLIENITGVLSNVGVPRVATIWRPPKIFTHKTIVGSPPKLTVRCLNINLTAFAGRFFAYAWPQSTTSRIPLSRLAVWLSN